jgi:hypothetical protein
VCVCVELARWCRRAGGTALAEPRDLDLRSDRRPDIDVTLGGDHFIIDVSIKHPLAQSYVGQDPEAVVRRAESSKEQKYGEVGHQQGATFVPFIMTTMGVGPKALSFIARIIKHGAEAAPSSGLTKRKLVLALQGVLMKGNFRCLTNGRVLASRTARQ